MDDVARTTSRRSDVDRLIADLGAANPVRRDAAVARLRVIGSRALPRLAAFITSASTAEARALAIGALDGIDDRQACEIAMTTLGASDAGVVIAALSVLRPWVTKETGTRILEAVAAIAVDRAREARVRLAAIDALSDLPEPLLRPIREQAPPPEAGGPPLDNPVAAREWVEAHGRHATLATVHDTVTRFRESEERAETSRARDEWMRARGVAHRVLAERGSRLALYDARETFSATAGPLPPGFLDALALVGDGSCLEPLARAWSAAQDATWRAQLAATARQIIARAKLGGRSAVVKGIRANWAGFI